MKEMHLKNKILFWNVMRVTEFIFLSEMFISYAVW